MDNTRQLLIKKDLKSFKWVTWLWFTLAKKEHLWALTPNFRIENLALILSFINSTPVLTCCSCHLIWISLPHLMWRTCTNTTHQKMLKCFVKIWMKRLISSKRGAMMHGHSNPFTFYYILLKLCGYVYLFYAVYLHFISLISYNEVSSLLLAEDRGS